MHEALAERPTVIRPEDIVVLVPLLRVPGNEQPTVNEPLTKRFPFRRPAPAKDHNLVRVATFNRQLQVPDIAQFPAHRVKLNCPMERPLPPLDML
jgi:hypothetical protein